MGTTVDNDRMIDAAIAKLTWRNRQVFFSSPEGIGITAKNRKDQEESIKFNDNGYYRGLDRNIWKVSDYAGTNIVKVR